MQDPTISTAAATFPQLKAPQFPEQEQLKCPRCESTNTKFCYYNNYNLSQPRHFCKSCRRYWTKGGALRNIPVGGGSRKNTKRSSKQRPCSSLPQTPTSSVGPSLDGAREHKPVPILTSDIGTGLSLPAPAGGVGSFTSLLGLASSGGGEGQFGNLFLEGLAQSGLRLGQESGTTGQNSGLKLMQESRGGSATSEGMIMGIGSGGDRHHHQMQSCWGAASNNGWPDLAIYTPGSKFQ